MPRPVLLIDDDLAEIALVKRVLERGRHEARVVTNVSDAWSELARASPEVVLLAPECDGGEGAELARRMTGQPGARPVALVLLGAAIEGVLARVVPRPIDARDLEEALERAEVPTATAPPAGNAVQRSDPSALSVAPPEAARSRSDPSALSVGPPEAARSRRAPTPTSTRAAPPRPTAPRLAFDRSPSRFEEASELRAAERELWLVQERERRLPPPLERALVEEKLRLVERADYFDILGIGTGCSALEVQQAMARLLVELTAERCPAEDALLREQVEEIRRVVSEAGVVLGDDGLRAAYRRAVGR